MKKMLALLVACTLLLAVAMPALAHVRYRDKTRMCNGRDATMHHFHGNGLTGYYFYVNPGRWDGSYRHYEVYKKNRFGTYDHAGKVVNCRYY